MLPHTITKHLLSYQIDHTRNLVSILSKNRAALDSSDTGTGKTYCAIAACAHLGLRPCIICPKSVISTWDRVCKIFRVTPVMIVNYETARTGKYYVERERVKCPYIETEKTDKGEYFKFIVNTDVLFIFDEAHRAWDISKLNGRLLYAAKQENVPVLVLSATIADYPERFKIFFYILNFIDTDTVLAWSKSDNNKERIYKKYQYIMLNWILRDPKPMWRIHHMLYPDRASRIRIDALGDLFPETQINATPYNMAKKRAEEIQKEYKILNTELEELKEKTNSDKPKENILVKVMRAHQKIELLKVPLFVELANDFFENKYSVVIFVNFTQTLELLKKMLNTECVIYGKQDAYQREKNINDFQDNKTNIIICNIKAGSVGVSLHDLDGKHPRASLISPTWSSIDLQQALGRIHRAGGKSKSLQRIVYVADTIEEKIAEKLENKLKDINTINNGDLDLTGITFERERINA